MSFIILDRDGVINHDSEFYIKNPDEWNAIPGSLAAIAKLYQAGYRVLIATNQSGVARGLYDLATLEKIHEKLLHQVKQAGGEIEEIFFCPHHPDECCGCRKPKPGLLYQIQEKYQLVLEETFFVGDSIGDILAAQAAGCKPMLVLTGNGKKTIENYPLALTVPQFENLAAIADTLVNNDFTPGVGA